MPPAMKSVLSSEFVGKKRKNSEVSISVPAAKRSIPLASFPGLPRFLFFGLRSI